MLAEIGLKNFKCFRDAVRIPTGMVNLFTGINGHGKSTILQALLLMRQSPEHSRTTDQVIFNGSCVELGSFDDVRNSDVSKKEALELKFRFQDGENYAKLDYFLRENVNDDMVARIAQVQVQSRVDNQEYTFEATQDDNSATIESDGKSYPLYWKNLLFDYMEDRGQPFAFINKIADFTNIHHISADRIGPRDYYPKRSFTEFPNVGSKGEYTANLLSKKKNDPVYARLWLGTDITHTVLAQTQAWLSKVFGGARIDVQTTEANIILMSLNSDDSLKTYKPINVGFGYSYALPIIVAGLVAREGQVLIVENPEAHLHPHAQSQITKFLANVSSCGIQVFIESHSDHVLNALRVAVLDKIIEPNELNVLYFDKSGKDPVVNIPVNPDGSIEYWPQGFFDQIDKDFERLFGV